MVSPYLTIKYATDHDLQRKFSWVLLGATVACSLIVFISQPHYPHKRITTLLYESNKTAFYEDVGVDDFGMEMSWNKMILHLAITIACTQTVTLRFVEQFPFFVLQFVLPLVWAAAFPDPTPSSNYLQLVGISLALFLLCVRM